MLGCFDAEAQKKSSSGDLKGIDFSAGFSMLSYTEDDAIKIYSEIVTPNLLREGSYPLYYSDGYVALMSNIFRLRLCTKNKWFSQSAVFKNSENRFGIGYSNYRFSPGAVGCSIITSRDTIRSQFQEAATIKYYGYSVNTDYLINSKPFLKNFAAYGGLGLEVGLNLFKAVDGRGELLEKRDPYLSTRHGQIKLSHDQYALSSLNGKAIIGLKFNLSCDFNLFMEESLGAAYYHKGLSRDKKFLWLGEVSLIGIRYKFIAAADRSRSKASVFW